MQVIETLEFADWLGGLRDAVAKRAIVKRLLRLQSTDHFGDAAPVGDGISEMRFHMGPGYRVYYILRDGAVILCGGDKGSQQRDITRAKELAAQYD
jgi:putative addiction module killer protein